LYCIFSDNVKGGAYYSNCLEKPSQGMGGIANNPEAWKRLWNLSDKTLKDLE